MSHFYDCDASEPFLTEARTPTQAKKINAYPSVTTVMGIIKDPFLDGIWSPNKFVQLARENKDWDMDEIFKRKFGMRTSLIAGKNPSLDSEWDSWAEPFLKHISDNNIEPVASELIAWDDELKVAGSVDFVGKMPDGKYYMADYKCRDCKGRGGKFYEKKDCTQLAIESWMLARMWDLDYLPWITSVCIDIETKKHYHKEWTWKQMQKGIERFKLMAEIYWMDFMNP